MDIRRAINSSPVIATILVLIILAVCGWFLWGEMKPAGPRIEKAGFYTVDEGKTWFVDELERVPPFDKNGRPAVRVYLFKCEGNSKPVAGYLERYTEKGKAVIQKYRAEQKAKPGAMPSSLGEVISLGRGATEVKKPGDATWVNMNQGEAMKIIQFACPSGPTVAEKP